MVKLISKIQPYIVTAGILLLTFFLGKSCNDTSVPDVEIRNYTDTNWVERQREVRVPVDSLVPRDTLIPIFDTIDFKIDTPSIIRDYFSKKFYETNYTDDTATFCIEDTISQNSITSRVFTVNYKIPYIKDSTYTEITKYKNGFYVGGSLGMLGQNQSITPSILFIDKSRSSYSIGYDLIQRNLTFGYYYRLDR